MGLVHLAQGLETLAPPFLHVAFFDYTVHYLTGEIADDDEALHAVVDVDDHQEVEPALAERLLHLPGGDEDGPEARMECDKALVYPDGVVWEAYVKHTDVRITTEEIPLAELEAIARMDGRPI